MLDALCQVFSLKFRKRSQQQPGGKCKRYDHIYRVKLFGYQIRRAEIVKRRDQLQKPWVFEHIVDYSEYKSVQKREVAVQRSFSGRLAADAKNAESAMNKALTRNTVSTQNQISGVIFSEVFR